MYWPPGSGYYFLSGVHVPYAVVMKPGSLTASRILRERNAEVRRVMLETEATGVWYVHWKLYLSTPIGSGRCTTFACQARNRSPWSGW